MIWVVDLIRTLDPVGPGGWQGCAPIWRHVEHVGAEPEHNELERHACEVAIDDLRILMPEAFLRLREWRRQPSQVPMGLDETFLWLQERIDRILGP